MPQLINHLKKESQLIQLGLELLQAYREDLLAGKEVSPEDMRMAVFALQVALEKSHLVKEERILFPALKGSERWQSLSPKGQSCLQMILGLHQQVRQSLLEFRLAIVTYERDFSQKGLIGWRLGEFVELATCYLKIENDVLFSLSEGLLSPTDQKELFYVSQRFDADNGIHNLQSPRVILSQLRNSKGLSAA